MPELPEVETIRRTLEPRVEGKIINSIDLMLDRLIKWPSAHEFISKVSHREIKNVERRGKYLLFKLSGDIVMIVHLRMTGRLYSITPDAVEDRFTKIRFNLDDGTKLIYADSRTLGTLYALPADELWRISGLSALGPEPLSKEFTLEYLKNLLTKRHGKIKAILLNQQLIGGLGNIYADESLALAGVYPERVSSSLTADEVEKLYEAINKVIQEGINNRGTTFRDYRDGLGQSGNNQNHLLVYGRKDEPCKICGTKIEWKIVAGRGTSFCPHCQK